MDQTEPQETLDLGSVFESSVYARRPWLRNYPPEVSQTSLTSEFSNLAELFDHGVRHWPKRIAFRQFGQAMSYARVCREAQKLQSFLQKHCTARDRVAIMMPNCLAQPIIFQAVTRARMTVVNINPQYTAPELAEILNDSRPVAIFIWDGALPALHKSHCLSFVPKVVVVSLFDFLPAFKRVLMTAVLRYIKRLLPATEMPDGAVRLSSLRRQYASAPIADQSTGSAAPDDAAVLQYTGGTTGMPKGATLTHKNLLANVEQIVAYLHAELKDPDRQVVVVTPLPLYHIFALMVNHLLFYRLGGENRLIANPRNLDSVIETLRIKPSFNVFVGVNTLFQALVDRDDFSTIDFSALRWCIGGGMQVRQETAQRWRECTGQELLQGYGLTEASPVVCFNPYTAKEFNGSIGLPIPGTDVMILNENNQAVEFGVEGELIARGDQVMKGYWNKPDETSLCLSQGWLRTGDMATMDEQGYCYIVDRIKDIINVSGFKVFPNEIESIVESHAGIKECACVGIRDSDGDERVKIVVVRAPGSNLDSDRLNAWLEERLTPYKRPRQIEWVEELAKTNVGKVLRRAVRETNEPSVAAPHNEVSDGPDSVRTRPDPDSHGGTAN